MTSTVASDSPLLSSAGLNLQPVFSYNTVSEQTDCQTAQKVALVVCKIVLFPWGVYDLIQYATQRTIMAFVYPAQNCIAKTFCGQHIQMQRALNTVHAMGLSSCVHEVVLERNGVKYQGWMIYKPGQERNKNWVVQAVGNNTTVETYLPTINTQYAEAGFNTLLLNNPGVGYSEGTATAETIGEAQDLAMIYVESLGAERVAFAGHSMGGAAMGLMALRHHFRPGIKYLSIPQMTFDRLSNAIGKMVPCIQSIAAPLLWWTGLEMDTVRASQRLHDLKIQECVINAQVGSNYIHDRVIPAQATLGHGIKRDGIPLTHKTVDYQDLPDLDHFSNFPFVKTAEILKDWATV